MERFDRELLKKIHRPDASSHKGDNGRLLIVAGSGLFHGAALWPAEIASRIVDLVFFASTPFNNKIFESSREVFRNGIVVPRAKLDDYAAECDAILVGPGMTRTESEKIRNSKSEMRNLKEIIQLADEGEQTYFLTKYLLERYSEKKFVIDGGALQMMETEWLDGLKTSPILTPHQGEFRRLQEKDGREITASLFAKKHSCVVLLKGRQDVVCDSEHCIEVSGGNAGMTKGGSGDVLAGLVASFYTKSPAFASAAVAAYINKRAGDSLYDMVGPYFNASDLAREVPVVMHELLTG